MYTYYKMVNFRTSKQKGGMPNSCMAHFWCRATGKHINRHRPLARQGEGIKREVIEGATMGPKQK